MTYIKPETAANQLPNSIPEILHLGLAAAQREDWLSLNNYLKQLPQTKSRNRAKRFILKPKEWQTALDLAIKMLIEAEFQHKWSIIKILPFFGEDIIPTLTPLVRDTAIEADVRWFACQALGNFNHPRVILTLVELLESTADPELTAIAGKTLTKIGDNAVDVLEKLLTKPQHRDLAVQSLYYIRTAKTIEPLLTITKDPKPELRAIALKALGTFHDSRIPPVLIDALQDKASDVRKEAAIALGFRRDLCQDLNLVDSLRPLLLDFNLEVCRQAAVSLGRMKDETAITALFDILQKDTTPVELKLDLVKALGWSQIPLAIDCLANAIKNSPAIVAEEIVTILGRTTISELKPAATLALIEFWQSKNSQLDRPRLKQAIATSLGELRCDLAREALEELVEDSDRKVKLHAISALKKISPN